MKNFLICAFLIKSIFVFCQLNFVALDTTYNKDLISKLSFDYKSKYKIINSNIDFASSKQRRIIREIYNENQKSFLEVIDKNSFISDKNINTYLQSLFSEILSKNNIDPKDYKILLSKDATVNAYNVGDGTIVINYGLLTVVENEDELVFVICHEIGHQYLNHVKNEIENYAIQSTSDEIIAKTNEIKRQKYRKATLANNLLKTIRYKNYRKRRQKEIEADSIGLNFYKKTMRNQENVLGLLKKLENSNKENDSLSAVDYKLIFDKKDFKLKSKYFETDESIFQKYDFRQNSNIDSLKTHPDCATRIKLLSAKIDKNNYRNNKKVAFDDFKKYSNYQNLVNLYNSEDYGICIYEALKYLKKDINNVILKDIICQSMQKIGLSKSNYTISRYLPDVDKKNNSTSLNTFITFINNIKLLDLEIIIKNLKT